MAQIKHKNLEIIIVSVGIILLFTLGTVIVSLHKSNKEKEDLAEQLNSLGLFEKEKYKKDSLNLVSQFAIRESHKDSIITSLSKELENQTKIKNYYAGKYKAISTMPIANVNAGLDSLFSKHK